MIRGKWVKGFKFKLQSVLEAREKKFEDRQLEFVKVQNKLLEAKKALEFLYSEVEQTQKGLELIIKAGKMDYTLIFCHQNYLSKLDLDIKNQHGLIKTIEKELEKKNKLMLEALKEKTMMEKLKEKALEDFKKYIERQEMINIDEIATNRYKKTG